MPKLGIVLEFGHSALPTSLGRYPNAIDRLSEFQQAHITHIMLLFLIEHNPQHLSHCENLHHASHIDPIRITSHILMLILASASKERIRQTPFNPSQGNVPRKCGCVIPLGVGHLDQATSLFDEHPRVDAICVCEDIVNTKGDFESFVWVRSGFVRGENIANIVLLKCSGDDLPAYSWVIEYLGL
jgi:hypothetical protein